MLRLLDKLLNQLTMYAVVYYGLLILVVVAAVLGFAGQLSFGGWSILLSAAVLLTTTRVTNFGLAKLLKADTNFESPAVTALILCFIMAPPTRPIEVVPLVLAGVVAMASKYLVAVRYRHIFNPAAFAVVALGILGNSHAIWWVATPVLLPAVAVLALLVVRKLQRGWLFLAALATGVASITLAAAAQGYFTTGIFVQAFTSWPLVFFASIMLTEPTTMPPTRGWRYGYAVLVAALFGSQLHVGPAATTPELCLLIGNALSFLVGHVRRVGLTLVEQRAIAADTFEFVFKPDRPLHFQPGQYLEWTLMHPRPDLRGSRRYFTIAASPTESDIRLGLKLGPGRISSFKTALQSLQPGARLSATGPVGDFTLPVDPGIKLLWIAGGIGITPFRSQVQYLLDSGQRRDVVLLYLAAKPEALAYRQLFEQASSAGLLAYFITPPPGSPPFGIEDLARMVPDFHERTVYLSGPSGLVHGQSAALAKAGVPRQRLHTDDFPGY